MKEDYHIDLSNQFHSKKITGIASVGAITKSNNGCGLNRNLKNNIRNKLYNQNIHHESAKLYAICIYYLIKENTENIKRLIICNDEDFKIVKNFLLRLIKEGFKKIEFEIINITEYRKILGRKVNSLADNYARSYAKRALKRTRWNKGKKINVIKITYEMIDKMWKQLK